MAFWPAAFPAVLGAADAAAARSGLDPVIGGSPAAGVLYAGLPSTADPVAVAGFVLDLRAAFAAGLDGGGPTGEDAAGLPPTRASAVVVRAAETVRDRLDLWGPVMSLGLMRAVKSQFDPGQRMSPGRFAGGI
jgi:glycolate oxidase FAD binding subunit